LAIKGEKTPFDGGHTLIRPLEQVMHNSMLPYAEYVIMERALPRVEDGLKPVQRRILYTMMELSLWPDRPHRKSARIVGDTMGKYHPHGDTAVYEAMVRMAQNFNMSATLVDGHGNFGSVDGDTAAAMRYTEARLTPLACEMLRDIEKETVPFTLNFDDTLKEPKILPSRFPNLLVNGASGIAVGLATNIPPHNLGEVVRGVIAYYQKPEISLSEMMQHIPGPDFPTGGFCTGGEELLRAYETGRGRLRIRAKTAIEREKSGKNLIVITELPFQVNKAKLLEMILKTCEEKKGVLLNVADIRDESDRTGMRAVVEVKKGADAEAVRQTLFRYTDLEITYGVNIMAIAEGRPQQLGLMEIIRMYAQFQKTVVTARTQYDLDDAEKREHILQGLLIAVDNLDEVIAIIRGSENPKQARERLMKRFDLTGEQAQAILDMRLRRLTALERLELEQEYKTISALIAELRSILGNEKKLISVIVSELKEIAKKYAVPRRCVLTELAQPVAAVVRQEKQSEPCDILFTQSGYVKRIAARGGTKAVPEAGENICVNLRCQTQNLLRFFTDRGNVFTVTAEEIPECKLKDRGASVYGILSGLQKGENIISLLAQNGESDLLFLTAQGMVKRTAASEFSDRRGKLAACGLKGKDSVLCVLPMDEKRDVLLVAKSGLGIRFASAAIPRQGRTAAGVKGMALQDGDVILLATQEFTAGDLVLMTERGYAKRMPMDELATQNRGGKGNRLFAFEKGGQSGEAIVAALIVERQETLSVVLAHGETAQIPVLDIPLDTVRGKGVPVLMVLFDNVITSVYPSFVVN
jgi:DNA gyrase subunit A